MIVNKELDGQGFVKQKKPYPDHRYIDDTTSWIYSKNIHYQYMCHVSWMFGSWIHVLWINGGLDMDIEVLVICVGHTA